MTITRGNPDELYEPPAEGKYAQVLGTTRGKKVFVAGMIAKNQQDELVGVGDMNKQLRVVLQNIEQALSFEEATLDDVVRRRTFTTDMERFLAEQDDVYSDFWNEEAVPASTLVEVSSLADTHQSGIAPGEPTDVEPRFLVEMDVTALIEN